MSTINLNFFKFRRSLKGAGVLKISIRVKCFNFAKISKIIMWSVRGLKTIGKLVVVEKGMKRIGLLISAAEPTETPKCDKVELLNGLLNGVSQC